MRKIDEIQRDLDFVEAAPDSALDTEEIILAQYRLYADIPGLLDRIRSDREATRQLIEAIGILMGVI